MEVASLALLKGDKILVVRDRDEDFWTLPGGKIEEKESKKQAVKREIREELPLVKWESLDYKGEFFGITPHSRQCIVIHVFQAVYSEGSIKPHMEITGSRWIKKREEGLKMTKSTQNIINSFYTDKDKRLKKTGP